ncbi:hypothetical protein, partial [Escherichia coli]|uniref:hypothetical protein n=1 Tax=Escherichia coli TaxID=562 RepID=UPI0015BB5B56
LRIGAAGVEVALGKLQSTKDYGKHIIEIMRDTTGELANRLHLLRLAELFLRSFAFTRLGAQLLGRLGYRFL